MISVHEALNLPQQPATVLSGPSAGSSSAQATTPSSASTPTFGAPRPPRIRKRVSVSGPSNGNGNGTAGRSRDDAIAIDDDDDDHTVALSTPAIRPTPAPLTHLPPSTYAAPPPPDHPPPPVALVETCPMCRKICGLDLRTCAERNGGRKGLKDRIRSLHAIGNSGGDGITALYEVYQAVSLVLLFSVISLTLSGLGKKLRGRGSSESELDIALQCQREDLYSSHYKCAGQDLIVYDYNN